MLLEVNGLTKRFGGVRAVDDVSWQMDAGQVRCIMDQMALARVPFSKC